MSASASARRTRPPRWWGAISRRVGHWPRWARAGLAGGAALGLGEGALQQTVFAQLQHLGAGLIALGGDGGDPLSGGLLHLALAQLHTLLEHLLLAFCFLETGVFLGVDLREAVQLLAQRADLFFELVALAPLGPQGVGAAVVIATRFSSCSRCRGLRLSIARHGVE